MSSRQEREQHGEVRHQLHRGQASHRPLSKGYEAIGLAGEDAFAAWAGVLPDRTLKPGGSRSINFTIHGLAINVLTARIPQYLLVERGKATADIYVLYGYNAATDTAYPVGWATQEMVLAAPVSDVGKMGVLSHAIPGHLLRHLDSLRRMLNGRAPDRAEQGTLF